MMMLFAPLDILNESELTFPIFEVFHITGLAMSVGLIALVDFRLLGWAMPKQDARGLARDLSLWTMVGLAVVFLSGAGLFLSDPDDYAVNEFFQMKMAVLLVALVFHYTVHDRMVARGSPGAAKVTAWVSLALWFGVVMGGIFIGFA